MPPGLSTHLDGVKLFFRSIPLVSQLDDGRSASSDGGLFTDPILFEQARRTGIIPLFTPPRTPLFATLGRPSGRSLPGELGPGTQEVTQLELGPARIALLDARRPSGRSTRRTTLRARSRRCGTTEMTLFVGRSLRVRVVVRLPAVLPLDARMPTRRFGTGLRPVISIAMPRTERTRTTGRRIPRTGCPEPVIGLARGKIDLDPIPILAIGMLQPFPRLSLLLVFPHVQHLVEEGFLLPSVSQHDGLLRGRSLRLRRVDLAVGVGRPSRSVSARDMSLRRRGGCRRV